VGKRILAFGGNVAGLSSNVEMSNVFGPPQKLQTRKTSIVIRITTSALSLINQVDYKIICFQANLEPFANNNKTSWKRT
jgi:hypothetical protein